MMILDSGLFFWATLYIITSFECMPEKLFVI